MIRSLTICLCMILLAGSVSWAQQTLPGFYPRTASIGGPNDNGSAGEVLITAGDGTADWGATSIDIGDAVGSGTEGSVLFVGAGPVLSQDNAGLFFDATNNWLGIGDDTPDGDMDVLSDGTTAVFALASASGKAIGLYGGGNGAYFQYDDSGTFGIRATPNASIKAGTYGGTTQVNIKTEVDGETALGMMNSTGGSWTGAAVYCDTSQRVGVGKTASLTAQLDILSGATDRVGLIVDSQPSVTANLAEFKNNGTDVLVIDKDGTLASVNGSELYIGTNYLSNMTYQVPGTNIAKFQMKNDNGSPVIFQWESGHLEVLPGASNAIYYYEDSVSGENREIRLYGFPTGGAKDYASLQMTGTTTDLTISTNRSGSDINLAPDTATNIGDGGTTNYTEVESDGSIEMHGTATVFDDLRVPVQSVKVGGAAPTWAQIKDDGAGSTGVFAYLFATGADDEVHFAIQLPHSYKEGSDITPHVHWSPVDATAGGVTWGLEYTWANIDGTYGNTTIITSDDATDSTADKHHISLFSAISGSGKTISSMLICRLFRDVSDANDTYAADAALLEIDFHYEMDTIGSRTVSAK